MTRAATTLAVILLVLATGTQASQNNKAASNPISGTWECVAHGGEKGDVPFTLSLQDSGGALTGSISSPQGDADLTSVSYKDDQLEIDINTDEANYALKAAHSDDHLSGTWFRDGEKRGTWDGKRQANSQSSQ